MPTVPGSRADKPSWLINCCNGSGMGYSVFIRRIAECYERQHTSTVCGQHSIVESCRRTAEGLAAASNDIVSTEREATGSNILDDNRDLSLRIGDMRYYMGRKNPRYEI